MKKLLFFTLNYTAQKPGDYYLSAACMDIYQVWIKSNLKDFPQGPYRLFFIYREYLMQTIHALVNRKRYDGYVFMEPQIGILAACLARILKLKMPKIMLINFIPRRQKICQAVLDAFYRFSLIRVEAFSVSSRGLMNIYAKQYGITPVRQFFIPDRSRFHRVESTREDDFLFAGGYSYRDWAVLLNAARILPAYKFIVCASGKERAFFDQNWLHNVTVNYDVSIDKFYDFLSRSTMVLMPLQHPDVAAGHVVILHALYYGKPVIATKTVGTAEYIEDGVNGILFRPGDAEDLSRKIQELMENREHRDWLKANAMQSSILYTCGRFTLNVHKMIDSVMA